MGIIKRQTIKSTVYIYAGTVLGFITTALLFPKFFTAEQVGLLSLLVSYGMMFGQFGTMGFNGATVRFFPYFRNKDKQHHGFLFLLTIITLVGFALFLGIFFAFRPVLLERNLEKSPLFAEYIDYIIPLTFFQLVFLGLDSYNRVLYNATTGQLLKEFVQRLLMLMAFGAFYLGWTGFGGFVLLYCLAFGITSLLLVLFLIWQREFSLRPDFTLLDQPMRRNLLNLSVFSFLTGFSGFAVTSIDRIMLNEFYSTTETGIYFIAASFGTLIILPSRAMKGIAPTLIADAFKNDHMEDIERVYTKSTITQLIMGLYLLLGMWANIGNILQILPPEYAAGKYVILWIGIMNLLKMLTGVNDVVIGYSKYYKYFTFMMVFWLVLLVVTNLLLIPPYNMNGAAIASVIAMLIISGLQFWFVYRKFGFQPYGKAHVYAFGISIIVYGVVLLLPDAHHFMVDILIKGTVITVLFVPAVYFLRLSDDINGIIDTYLAKLKVWFGS